MAADEKLTPDEHLAWNVACDAFARVLEQYKSERLEPRLMLLVSGFIVAYLSEHGDPQPAADATRDIARRVLRENLAIRVRRPDADTVVVTTTSRNDEN